MRPFIMLVALEMNSYFGTFLKHQSDNMWAHVPEVLALVGRPGAHGREQSPLLVVALGPWLPF